MAKRILALLAAAGLIVASIALRSVLNGDGDAGSGGNGGGDGGPATTRPTLLAEVWCLEDLRTICEAVFGSTVFAKSVSLTIEPMDAALARLAAADVEDDLPDAWITFAPLPEMAKDAVRRASGPADSVATSTDLVATTSLIIATRPDRVAILSAECPPPMPWRCLGFLAGQKWETIGGPESFQNVKPGFGDPTTSATALMVWASAVGHYLGREMYSINDVTADEDFTGWGRTLRAADPTRGRGDPLSELVLSRVQRDVAGGTHAAFAQLTGLSLVPDAYGRVDVVIAGFAGTTLTDTLRTGLSAGLVAAGWTAADATTPIAARPSFTTYVALQTTWKELG